MSPLALPVAVLGGVSLHAGLFHLLLCLRTRERRRRELIFGITALLIAVFDFACVGLYMSTDPEVSVLWQRAQIGLLTLTAVSFVYLVDALGPVRGPRWARQLVWIYPVLGFVGLVERRGWLFGAVSSIRHFTLPLVGEARFYENVTGPLYYVTTTLLAYLIGYVIVVAVRTRRAGEPRQARTLLLVTTFFGLGSLYDILVASDVMRSLYVLEYTLTSIIVLAGYSLSNEVVAAALAKQALAQSRLRLAHAERLESIGRLAGGVAHDLNNMLTPVLGYAQLTQQLVKEGTPERQYVDHLAGAAERAAALTQQLLAFGRRQQLEVKPLDLAQTLNELEPLLRRLLPEDISLQIDSAKGLPPVEADRAQLEQVWMNLAANARDAMRGGGALRFSVDFYAFGDDPGIVVSVTDTGVGMEPAVAEHVFDPFFTTKARGEGTGLGLSIVQGIVEQHGGRIEVDSAPGKGTTFRLFFPSTGKTLRPSARRAAGQVTELRGCERVLVVDDDDAVRQLVLEVLTKRGYEVRAASSGAALRKLLDAPDLAFDLLLTDVILPDIDGNQVRSLVIQRLPNVRCIFMTGHADEVLGPRGVLREQVELLRKPFNARELAEKVRAVLDRAPAAASERPSTDGRGHHPWPSPG